MSVSEGTMQHSQKYSLCSYPRCKYALFTVGCIVISIQFCYYIISTGKFGVNNIQVFNFNLARPFYGGAIVTSVLENDGNVEGAPIANQTFNRAKLLNVGFKEALKLYNWQCFIFHDVDLLPEDDRNLYTCPQQPRHMSVAVDKFKYSLPYSDIFGGITALTTDQFKKLNGYSNDFWGWGGEDDEMASRVKINGFKVSRYGADIARYKMIRHSRENANPVNTCRFNLMYKVKKRWKEDGLSSLKYEIVKSERKAMFTWFLVDLLEKESKAGLDASHICSGKG